MNTFATPLSAVPTPLRRFVHRQEKSNLTNPDGSVETVVECPRNTYLLVLVLRWILSTAHNNNADSRFSYHIFWKLEADVQMDRLVIHLLSQRTDAYTKKFTTHKIATFEMTCRVHDSHGVVRFATGTFGSFGMCGVEGVKRLIQDAVESPYHSVLPYYTRHAFVVAETEGNTTWLDIHQDADQPYTGLVVTLERATEERCCVAACTRIVVE